MSSEIESVLPEEVSLQLYHNAAVIFESSGKWLHPLFEVEDFLESEKLDVSAVILHDKVAGQAAALLISRMGFTRCIIDLVSKPALDVFKRNNVSCFYTLLVDRIACKTEEIITHEMELEYVYRILSQRAGRVG